MGRFRQAIPELRKAYAIAPTSYAAGTLGYAYATSGDRTEAMQVIEDLRRQSAHRFVSPLWPATIYLGLGDRQRSLDGLEKAYEAHDPWLMNLKMDRMYAPLRSDPRFIELLRKMGMEK